MFVVIGLRIMLCHCLIKLFCIRN